MHTRIQTIRMLLASADLVLTSELTLLEWQRAIIWRNLYPILFSPLDRYETRVYAQGHGNIYGSTTHPM